MSRHTAGHGSGSDPVDDPTSAPSGPERYLVTRPADSGDVTGPPSASAYEDLYADDSASTSSAASSGSSAGSSADPSGGSWGGSSPRREVTCPACRLTTPISINRRESADFCPGCDYPLFFGRNDIVLDAGGSREPADRRRPGVAGRTVTSSRRCPWPDCGEPNDKQAVTCLRCGKPMSTPAPATPPPPAPAAPAPRNDPAPAPPPGTPWWWWALYAATALMIVAIVVVLALD